MHRLRAGRGRKQHDRDLYALLGAPGPQQRHPIQSRLPLRRLHRGQPAPNTANPSSPDSRFRRRSSIAPSRAPIDLYQLRLPLPRMHCRHSEACRRTTGLVGRHEGPPNWHTCRRPRGEAPQRPRELSRRAEGSVLRRAVRRRYRVTALMAGRVSERCQAAAYRAAGSPRTGR